MARLRSRSPASRATRARRTSEIESCTIALISSVSRCWWPFNNTEKNALAPASKAHERRITPSTLFYLLRCLTQLRGRIFHGNDFCFGE